MGTDDRIDCPICGGDTALVSNTSDSGNITHVSCEYCGSFSIAKMASMHVCQQEQNARIRLAAWIRARNRENQIPSITDEVIVQVASWSDASISDRADQLLQEIAFECSHLGDQIRIDKPRYEAVSQAMAGKELEYLSELNREQGYLKIFTRPVKEKRDGTTHLGDAPFAEITPKGYAHLNEIKRKPKSGKIVFVAMSFDKGMAEAWSDGLQKGILDAGYQPRRVDSEEHNNKIDDEIIALINSCAFVVSDFTGHRGGVYFEAGYALGKGLPVVWTCKKNDMDDLHFDTRQYNFISWSDTEDLAKRLKNRILGTIGPGPDYVIEAP